MSAPTSLAHPTLLRLLPAVSVVLAALLAFAIVPLGKLQMVAAVGLLVVIIGAYIGLRHPLWFFWALAFGIGAIPVGRLPFSPVPVGVSLALAVVLATLIHKNPPQWKLGPVEYAAIFLIFSSILSVTLTYARFTDVAELIKWTTGTLLIICLRRLPRPQLVRFLQILTWATFFGACFAFVELFVDKGGKLMSMLKPLGYQAVTGRYVYGVDGAIASQRLAGLYVDPNAAGICLFAGLMGAVLLFRGHLRVLFATVIFAALVLTLSRAALFSVVGGVVLVFVFGKIDLRARLAILGSFVLAAVVGFSIPSIRGRVFSSFGSTDTGSSARWDAIKHFPTTMDGHWLFGLGWGRPEFKDAALSFDTNFVANAPLLTVYRGGIFTGLAFVILLCVVMWYCCKLLRSNLWEGSFVGGIFIGFCLVALQLDFPVVTTPPLTIMFSIIIVTVMLAYEFTIGAAANPVHPKVRTVYVPRATVNSPPRHLSTS